MSRRLSSWWTATGSSRTGVTGARRLFGLAEGDALGRSAVDLLPAPGALPDGGEEEGGTATRRDSCSSCDSHGPYAAYDGLGPGLEFSLDQGLSCPAAGRARLAATAAVSRSGRGDVLWWAYPLVGPGSERLLVLDAEPTDEAGRGLRVVSTLAWERGASRTTSGKTVWFELTLPRR